MNGLFKKVSRFATWKTVLLFGIIFITLAILFFSQASEVTAITHGTKILDLQNFYTADQAYQVLDRLGGPGRQVYANILTNIDSFFPIATALFSLFMITFLFNMGRPLQGGWRYLIAAPVLACIFDYIENLCILRIITAYPHKLAGLASLAGIMTAAKSVCLVVVVITILFALIRLITKNNRQCEC